LRLNTPRSKHAISRREDLPNGLIRWLFIFEPKSDVAAHPVSRRVIQQLELIQTR
jgi:hypothetical protein